MIRYRPAAQEISQQNPFNYILSKPIGKRIIQDYNEIILMTFIPQRSIRQQWGKVVGKTSSSFRSEGTAIFGLSKLHQLSRQ